jgi:hypothetical protein
MKKYVLVILLFLPVGASADLARALRTIRPGAKWQLNGDTYEGLKWLDKNQKKPTKAEVLAALPQAERDEKQDLCRLTALQKLRQSDILVAPDSPLKNKNQWAAYRAALWKLVSEPVEKPTWPKEPLLQW